MGSQMMYHTLLLLLVAVFTTLVVLCLVENYGPASGYATDIFIVFVIIVFITLILLLCWVRANNMITQNIEQVRCCVTKIMHFIL